MAALSTILATANMPSRASIVSRASDSHSLSAHARAAYPKSDIDIHLKHHYKAKTYTSGSPVEGEVTITTHRDVRFDSIEIILLGCSITRTEGYSAPHESTHTFLKLLMPIPESTYPVPRVLESGRTLTVPFNFVLPSFLTLNACSHLIESDHIRHQHLRLPPSMGAFTRGSWEKDDMAPHMAEVVYSIKARVCRTSSAGPGPTSSTSKIMEAVKSIQVLPASAEDAPLSITGADMLYKMTRTKTLRRNLLSSKLGTLTVSGQQPRALILHPDGTLAAGSAVQLDLAFEPACPDAAAASPPPRLAGVATKVSAHTFYSSGAIRTTPDAGNWLAQGVASRHGTYSTSVALPAPAGSPPSLVWCAQKQQSQQQQYLNRRDSGYGSDSAGEEEDDCSGRDNSSDRSTTPPAPVRPEQRRRSLASLLSSSSNRYAPVPHTPSPYPSRRQRHRSPEKGPTTTTTTTIAATEAVRHTSTLHLPLSALPTAKKTFVPTFHSCILSRVYVLRVTLTLALGSGSGSTVSVSLDLPLQIAVASSSAAAEGQDGSESDEGDEMLPSWEDAVEDALLLGGGGGGGGGGGDVLPGYARR